MTAPPVIVGASVAGAVTALRLAASGVDSVVFEGRREPMAKVCGEGFHPPGRRALEAVLGDVSDLGSPLHGFRFTDARSELLTVDHPAVHVGLGCDRQRLEARLWGALRAHPKIEFRTGETVRDVRRVVDGWEVETHGGWQPAGYLIAADGVRSRLRSRSGRERGRLRGRWGARQRFRVTGPGLREVEICFLDDGEVFCTPLGADRVSIAVLGSEALVRTLRRPDLLAGYLARIRAGLIAPLLLDAIPESRPEILPHRGRRAVAWCRDRLFLSGDAAVFLDPISGAGMTIAALSAEVIASAIQSVVDGRVDVASAQARAERELRRQVRPFARLTRVLRTLGRSPLTRKVAIPMLRRAPRLLDALARAALGPRRTSGTTSGTLPRVVDRKARA